MRSQLRDRAATTLANRMSFAIVALALYGDLAKRVLPPTVALIALYSVAGAILITMLVVGPAGHSGQRSPISVLASLLILIYLAQLATSFSADIVRAFIAVAYVCVPLAFLVVIPRAHAPFDLRALAFYTTVLMVPVHIVGLIQEFVSPSFMISTVYSGELGGVIVRNFLDTGTYDRFPSIYTSADRYSGVAMLHIFLTFVLLSGDRPPTKATLRWVAFNLIAGCASLLIAGARSRIIIVVIALCIAGLVFLTGALRQRVSTRSARTVIGVLLLSATGIAAAFGLSTIPGGVAAPPVLSMLGETVVRDDVRARVEEGLGLSEVPADVTVFGEGLGTTGGGRPGEFAIRAMWIESGMLWTPIMLLIHACILFWLGGIGLRAIIDSDAVLALLAVGSALAWLFGLLAGLSGTFELSQGLLLFPTIAALMTVSRRRLAASRVRPMAAAPVNGWRTAVAWERSERNS